MRIIQSITCMPYNSQPRISFFVFYLCDHITFLSSIKLLISSFFLHFSLSCFVFSFFFFGRGEYRHCFFCSFCFQPCSLLGWPLRLPWPSWRQLDTVIVKMIGINWKTNITTSVILICWDIVFLLHIWQCCCTRVLVSPWLIRGTFKPAFLPFSLYCTIIRD